MRLGGPTAGVGCRVAVEGVDKRERGLRIPPRFLKFKFHEFLCVSTSFSFLNKFEFCEFLCSLYHLLDFVSQIQI